MMHFQNYLLLFNFTVLFLSKVYIKYMLLINREMGRKKTGGRSDLIIYIYLYIYVYVYIIIINNFFFCIENIIGYLQIIEQSINQYQVG